MRNKGDAAGLEVDIRGALLDGETNQLVEVHVVAPSSIRRQTGIDFLDPGENASLEVLEPGEPGRAQERDRLGTADSALAMNHHGASRVQLAQAIGQLAKGITVDPAIRQIAISSGFRTSRIKGGSA